MTIQDDQNLKKENDSSQGSPAILIICIVVIALTAGRFWDYACVDWELIFDEGLLPGLPLGIAISILYKRCMSYISDSSEGSNRTLGIIFLCVGIVTAIIAGPVRSNGYNLIASKATDTLNKKILVETPHKCLDVNIRRHVDDTYFGNAKLSNGENRPIVARFVKTGHSGSRRRTLRYKVTVDLQ